MCFLRSVLLLLLLAFINYVFSTCLHSSCISSSMPLLPATLSFMEEFVPTVLLPSQRLSRFGRGLPFFLSVVVWADVEELSVRRVVGKLSPGSSMLTPTKTQKISACNRMKQTLLDNKEIY